MLPPSELCNKELYKSEEAKSMYLSVGVIQSIYRLTGSGDRKLPWHCKLLYSNFPHNFYHVPYTCSFTFFTTIKHRPCAKQYNWVTKPLRNTSTIAAPRGQYRYNIKGKRTHFEETESQKLVVEISTSA